MMKAQAHKASMSVELHNKQRTRYFEDAQQIVEESSHQERAAVLHDDMAQLLAAMRLHLSSLNKNNKEGENFENRLLVLDELVGNAFVLLRQIAIELYPLGIDGEGLFPPIRALIRSLSERHDLNCKLIADESELDIGSNRALIIFRLLQHALEMIAQSRQADEVLIKLRRRQENILLTIDCQRSGNSENEYRQSAKHGLDNLRGQVKESGGRMRVIRIERGERFEMSVPRFAADLQ